MPTKFRELVKRLHAQAFTSGSIELTTEELPWARQIANLIGAKERRLVIRNANVQLPVSVRKLTMSPTARKRMSHVKRRLAEALQLAIVAVTSRKMPADEQLDPRLPLFALGPGRDLLLADLHIHGRTRRARRVVKMLALQASALVIRGTLDTGQAVHAAFWQTRTAFPDKAFESYLGLMVPGEFGTVILRNTYQSGLGSMTFGEPMLIGISTHVPGTHLTIPLFAGLHLYAGADFGPNLASAYTANLPMAVYGQASSDLQQPLRMTSTPFRLAFADTTVDACALHLRVAPFQPKVDDEMEEEDEGGSDEQLGSMEEEEQPEESPVYESEAALRATWHGRPVWTQLPFDNGVLSWNTVEPPGLEWRRPAVNPGDDDELLLLDETKFPQITLQDVDQMFGGWTGWREQQQVKAVVAALEDLRLGNAQFAVDLPTKKTAHVTVGLRARVLHQPVMGLDIGPCLVRLIVTQPSVPDLRLVQMSIRLRAKVGGIPFEGYIDPSDLSLSAIPSVPVTLDQIVTAFGLSGLYSDPAVWKPPAPVDFLLELALTRGSWSLTASNEHGKFSWDR